MNRTSPLTSTSARRRECKFWLAPIGLAGNRGIAAHNLREIEHLVFQHHDLLVRSYHEYHNR